jgi:hypothetical protein
MLRHFKNHKQFNFTMQLSHNLPPHTTLETANLRQAITQMGDIAGKDTGRTLGYTVSAGIEPKGVYPIVARRTANWN